MNPMVAIIRKRFHDEIILHSETWFSRAQHAKDFERGGMNQLKWCISVIDQEVKKEENRLKELEKEESN